MPGACDCTEDLRDPELRGHRCPSVVPGGLPRGRQHLMHHAPGAPAHPEGEAFLLRNIVAYQEKRALEVFKPDISYTSWTGMPKCHFRMSIGQIWSLRAARHKPTLCSEEKNRWTGGFWR